MRVVYRMDECKPTRGVTLRETVHREMGNRVTIPSELDNNYHIRKLLEWIETSRLEES